MNGTARHCEGPAPRVGAYDDFRLDNDGDCVVRDELTFLASADPTRDVFKVPVYFLTTSNHEQAAEFCQRFDTNDTIF